MRASLDTNIIIYLYRANKQNILFDIFTDGVFIYEQIRNIELEHHGKMVLEAVDVDIKDGKIGVYTKEKLKEQSVDKIFENNVKENRLLYGSGDLGEVYAISLAQTIGAYSLLTDDTKQGGSYMSLLQLDDYEIMPFNFADILILRYLLGITDVCQTVDDFNNISAASMLNWSLKSQLMKFIKRFMKDPYNNKEREWFKNWTEEKGINVLEKFRALGKMLR